MSIIGYAAITNSREAAQPGATFAETPARDDSSKKKYIDALAALVPAEVLAAHAFVLSYATKTDKGIVTIDYSNGLWYAFWGLFIASGILYWIPRWFGGRWERWDGVRMFIPGFAFIGWTMLQTISAFDAVFSVSPSIRAFGAAFLALVLGSLASALAYKVDQKKP